MRTPGPGPAALITLLTALGALLVGVWVVPPPAAAQEDPDAAWLTAPALHGMTGLINTPTAYVIPSGALRVGVGYLDEKWAYHPRLTDESGLLSDNYNYFLTFGFVSRLEVSIRASYFPDDRFSDADPEQKGTVDRGGNARVQALTEGKTRPAVALGIDDVRGTRRFHALYAVTSKTLPLRSDVLKVRLSAGYGSDLLDAKAYVLKGWFGGGEACLGRVASLAVDYDTEKWNTMLRLFAIHHLSAYVGLLDMEAPAGGLSWTHQF